MLDAKACRHPSRAWVSILAVWLVVGGATCRSAPPSTVTAEVVAATNRGVGLMGQFDFAGAVAAFEAAQAAAPQWAAGRLNLAIALMNRQGPGDEARAEALLHDLVALPDLADRARYVLGLLWLHAGRDAQARPLLTAAAEGPVPDGFAAYFVGQITLAEAPEEALAWYQRAQAHEPLLRSAYYGAFLALRRLGRDQEAMGMLERFQELEGHPQAKVAEFKYTRMGPLSEPLTVDLAPEKPPAPTGPPFQSPAPVLTADSVPWKRGGPARSVTAADINGDGALDLFIAASIDGQYPNAVLLSRGTQLVLDRSHPLAAAAGVRAALWGDLDDDGRVDVVLCRPAGNTQIWHQLRDGGWRPVPPAGQAVSGLDCIDGAVFDADHDGDLDIWLINASGPNDLLNNDGDLRFRPLGRTAGIAGDGRPSIGMSVADLDADRDTDVIVLKAAPPHDVFMNDRAWVYRRDPRWEASLSEPLSALLAGDVDADGHVELYGSGPSGLQQWRRAPDGTWRATRIGPGGSLHALAWADVDGDGGLELIASTEDGWAAYELQQPGSPWTPVAGAAGAAPSGWAVAQFDIGLGPSIVGVDAEGRPVVWRPGPGRLAYIGLSLSGRDPKSDQRRSNLSGVGTRVAVRTGSRWSAFETTRLATGPGQSLQPIAVGVGRAGRADFVSLVWPDGVLQTELALDAGRLHVIGETQRQVSSCPVLFAWTGRRFAFVTDVLGTGGIGFFERPGVAAPPFPREHVLLPVLPHPEDRVYRLKLAEPMEEVTYLDHASLVAYDLPPGWQLALDERKAVEGPAPTGAPVFYRDERLPARAVDDAGRDVREVLSRQDGRAVGPQEISPRFIGLARPFGIELEFDRPVADGAGRPTLLVDGWIEYPYSQTVFAAWQAGAAYEAPTLEARDALGRWHSVAPRFGYPAGMPRRMSLPLPALPAGAVALRLRTSHEIYWDRVAVAYAEPLPSARRAVLPLRSAVLASRGFARRTVGPSRRPDFDDDGRVPLADVRHPRGWYSEFGPVEALVSERDGALAIFGPGEELTLEFTAPAAPPRPGWTRRLVLELHGWCKDMDLYTRDGETVDPLPGIDTPARRRLHARFNTRYASGR